MKLNRLFLCATAAIAVVACNKEQENNVPVEKGKTYASLVVSTPKTRAAAEFGQTDDQGTSTESVVNAIKLYASTPYEWTSASTTASSNLATWRKSVNELDKFYNDNGTYYVQPFKMAVGKQKMGVAINPLSEVAGVFSPVTEDYVTEEANLVTIFGDLGTKIPMTSKVTENKVIDNKTAAEVGAGSTPTENVFAYDIERIVAKGIVAKASGFNATSEDGLGTVSDLKFAAVNGATKSYYFASHAGARQATKADNGYKGFESAIHDDGTHVYDTPENAKTAGLVRLGNYANDASIMTAKDVKEDASAQSVYFFENSVKEITEEMKTQGFYRLAYAKVYAKYTPKSVKKLKEGTGSAGVPAEFVVSTTTQPDGTFYVGKDGLFYFDKKSAEAAGNNKTTEIWTYAKGKCAYRVLWNRLAGDSGIFCADVRRNNTYKLEIASVKKIGMPWDPSDPKDPNLPKDPDDPVNPNPGTTDPSIETQESYMTVTAKILNWNIVPRTGISLGGKN